jgi:aspartate-semialdehyde dehydrogenase
VYAGHSLSINAQFKRDIPVDVALELLRGAAGVVVADVPNPLVATGRDPVFVGRVRRDNVQNSSETDIGNNPFKLRSFDHFVGAGE